MSLNYGGLGFFTTTNKMKVYILEGAHGSGKSYIMEELKQIINNISFIDENYLELTRFDCDSVLHQIDWVLNWVESVLKMHKSGVKTVLCDRGPLSVIIYGTEKHKTDIFTGIVTEIFLTLKENGIIIETLFLKSPERIEHIRRLVERNGKLVEKEIKILDNIRNEYEIKCKDFTKVENVGDVLRILNDIIKDCEWVKNPERL